VSQGAVWVLATPGQGPAGLIVLIPKSDHVLLDNVAVAPAYQRRALGRKLLAFAESFAIERGYGELRLYTHELMTENQSLYARLGYEETERRMDAGYRRVFMRKRLPAPMPAATAVPAAPATPAVQPRMTDPAELAIIRRAFGRQIAALAGVTDPRIEAAFASVPREQFLGLGPWQVLSLLQSSYVSTPDADPLYLYTNSVCAIAPQKRLNNGEPSLYAKLFDELQPSPGDHAVHIGAGVGYYTALLAQLVGPSGRVTGSEYEPELAARARRNCSQYSNIEILQGDGTAIEFDTATVILVG